MGIEDLAGKAKEMLGEGGAKAKEMLGDSGAKVADAVDKATDFIDDKTGGKFTDKLEAVDDKARELLGDDEKKA